MSLSMGDGVVVVSDGSLTAADGSFVPLFFPETVGDAVLPCEGMLPDDGCCSLTGVDGSFVPPSSSPDRVGDAVVPGTTTVGLGTRGCLVVGDAPPTTVGTAKGAAVEGPPGTTSTGGLGKRGRFVGTDDDVVCGVIGGASIPG